MLPSIESTSPGLVQTQPRRRPEADKAIEAYKSAPVPVPAEEEAANAAAVAEKQAGKASATELRFRDQAEIGFSLTPEERDAFLSAFTSKQDPATMSEEEKATLKKASERISSFIDEAISRNANNRERVEKAVGEWYVKITQGEQGPLDLVKLLRQAAMGQLEGFSN